MKIPKKNTFPSTKNWCPNEAQTYLRSVKSLSRLFLISTLLVLAASCERRQDNITIPGQGGSEISLMVTDTLTFKTTTVDEDSLPGNGVSYFILGELNDPLLGKTTASIYADLNLIEPYADFPNTSPADSAVLFIPSVEGFNSYGNRSFPINLRVYPLLENIESEKTYYQTDTFALDRSIYSEYTGKLLNEYTDSVRYQKDTLAPYDGIRIKLSKEFTDKLMSLPQEAYETNNGLDEHFKGIAIIPEDNPTTPNDGVLGVFDVHNALSLDYRAKILLYFGDSNTFVFGFSGKNQTVNHGETGPYPNQVQNQIDNPQQHQEETFSQALSGVKTKIELPYLYNLISEGNIAIHKAEITFHVKNYDEYFYAPPRMSLFKPFSKSSSRNFLIEDAVSSINYGGNYDSETGSYTFDITRHLQNVLNSLYFNNIDTNDGLYLAIPTDQPVIGARCVIDQSKTKIHITYSKPN